MKVWILKGRELAEASIDDITKKQFSWVNVTEPTDKDLRLVSEKTEIPLAEIKERLKQRTRPRITRTGNNTLILLKVISYENNTRIEPLLIIFSDRYIITIRKKKRYSILGLDELIPEKRVEILKTGVPSVLHRAIDQLMDHNFEAFDDVEDDIEKVENKILKSPDKKVLRKIFSLKKGLIYTHKAMTANREVILNIKNGYAVKISPAYEKRFQDLYAESLNLIEQIDTFRDILTGTTDIYMSSVSNNMNLIMKRLTGWGALILVPTLISGIYGMNFRNMPELYWHYGYAFALGLMVVSVILIYWNFKKKDYL